MAEGDVQSGAKRAPLIFLLVIAGYLALALYNANLIPDRNMTDKIIPLVIGGVSLACCLILLIQMMRRPEGNEIFADKELSGEDADAPYGLWSTLAWFAGLIAATSVVGFILALIGFLALFFRFRAGCSWAKTFLLTGFGIALMCAMASVLNRDFPPGLLQSLFELPWPLR